VFKKSLLIAGSMAHICNPGYSGGRDQEDRGQSQSGQINPISKKLSTKNNRTGGEAQVKALSQAPVWGEGESLFTRHM
jgi:hypothetical protein